MKLSRRGLRAPAGTTRVLRVGAALVVLGVVVSVGVSVARVEAQSNPRASMASNARAPTSVDASTPASVDASAPTAVDAAADSSGSTPTSATPRLDGAYRILGPARGIYGALFSPRAPGENRGTFRIYYNDSERTPLPRDPRDPELGTYELAGSIVRTRELSGGRAATITYQFSGTTLVLQLASATVRLDPAPSICRWDHDCFETEPDARAARCTGPVFAICEPRARTCEFRCDTPAYRRGRARCGPRLCPRGMVCCNSVSGQCTRPGEGCGQ